MTLPSSVLFREIHKNAWLRRLSIVDKRTGSHPKKGERVWTVFCVHDDTDPFLELYSDQKIAAAHKPDWCVSLSRTLHISPTICPNDDEFEFVVTLPDDIVRLTAPTWDLMMEWVDGLGNKLREMRILSPKENVYSRMPELRLPLLPTRDPNSPLPLPPAGPSTVVPGIELNSAPTPSVASDVSNADGAASGVRSEENENTVIARNEIQRNPSTTSVYITQSESPTFSRSRPVLNRTVSAPDSPTREHNVTVIQVSSATSPPQLDAFDFSFINESLTNEEDEEEEEFFTPPITPVLPRAVTRRQITNSTRNHSDLPLLTNPRQWINFPDEQHRYDSVAQSVSPTRSESSSQNNSDIRRQHSIPRSSQNNDSQTSVIRSTSVEPSQVSVMNSTPSVELEESSRNSELVEQESEVDTNGLYEHVFLPASQLSPTPPPEPSPRTHVVPGGRVRGGHRPRRRSAETNHPPPPTLPVAADRIRRLQPPPHPFRQTGNGMNEINNISRLTLREQQVLQLRREMLHPGGVRLQLRRKDCLASIALVDAFAAVWVAGWKQKEHPMLYNALHIGDQLLSIAGILVQNSTDAQKLIRGAPSLYVEFVVRRVPCGRVFALRRESEGQNLGIILEGNTAEIKDITTASIAASHGLSARTPTLDALSLTTWVITEVNGRPLNLFFKDGEVKDRLNAVGLDISLLVQPFDLMKQIKKQLKAMRSYKDYIVQ